MTPCYAKLHFKLHLCLNYYFHVFEYSPPPSNPRHSSPVGLVVVSGGPAPKLQLSSYVFYLLCIYKSLWRANMKLGIVLKWKGSICCLTFSSVLPLWRTAQMGPERKLKVNHPNKKHLPSGRFSCWPPASRPPPTPSQPRRWPSWCPPWWRSPPAAGSPALTWWPSVVQQGAVATAGQIARLSCGTVESEQTHTHTVSVVEGRGPRLHIPQHF